MKPDVVLLPSFAQVEDWRKRHVGDATGGLFSQTVTTFNAWIADLWELHGDGRTIVDSLQRRMVMQAAFDQIAGEQEAASSAGPDDGRQLAVSPGVVKLANQCMREAAGVPVFELALDEAAQDRAVPGVSPREMALLAGMARYRAQLEQAGLVEVGWAAAYLAAHRATVFPRAVSVLVAQASPLSWQMAAFFDACEQLDVCVDEVPGAAGIGPVAAGVELRFGFPSGRYAQPALVADLLRENAGQVSSAGASAAYAVVACKDPLAFYKQLEVTLAQNGFAGCVQAQVSFSSTDFGRRFLALGRVVGDDQWAKVDLSDAVVPPFAGFDKTQALQVDRELRGNRLARRDECLESLRQASDTFSQFEELVGDPEADVLLGVFEQIAFTSPARSDAWRHEQLTAAAAVRSCTKAARAVGASMKSCLRVLEDVSVTVSYEGMRSDAGLSAPAYAGRVVVTTQSVAAQMGEGACEVLVLCDLTSDDYPISDRDDAAATLFAKIGLLPADTMLAQARRRFTALQAVPAAQLVCVRPLNDYDGNPTYPAAMLQELVDAYMPEGSTSDDVDELFGLPATLMGSMVQRGEELLYANASAKQTGAKQAVAASVPAGMPGDKPPDAEARVMLPRLSPDGEVLAQVSPSPSQVEAYLECPYKWFAQRRLNIEELDEGFGPLERGSFCHAVLQRFYQEFIAMGYRKVDDDNLALAKELMRKVADEAAEAQYLLEPGSGRYVAIDQFERRELDACKRQLVDYLDFEAAFLPTFHPAYFEHEIGVQDGVVYAGHPFMGIVDRIDVDDAGNAVIVDYKGSVGPAHEIAGKGVHDPGKVQTRMYARAVERALGLKVVGAFYVSYGKSHGCAGAFDGRAIEAAHVPNARVGKCSCALEQPDCVDQVDDFSQLTFSGMLDATEALVSDAIDSMVAGRVQPAPATPDACRYCPVANCSARGA